MGATQGQEEGLYSALFMELLIPLIQELKNEILLQLFRLGDGKKIESSVKFSL